MDSWQLLDALSTHMLQDKLVELARIEPSLGNLARSREMTKN